MSKPRDGNTGNTRISLDDISMPTASRPSLFLIASGAYPKVHSNHNSTPRSKKQPLDSDTPNIPPMAFFSGASNIKITGGEFNEVRGNYIVYDQSRHHSNVNSYNTTNHSIVDSANDNSRFYHGTQNDRHRNPTNRDANRAPSGSLNGQASGNPPFPPSSVHPAMMQPEHLPPGSRVQNTDSFNSRNENIINVNNDNSAEYGIPAPSKRGKDRRRPGMRPEDDDDGRERRSSPRRQHSTWPANDQRSPFNQGARCGPGAFPTTSNAQFAPGQVQGMSFEFQKTLDTLMHQVQEEITPQPAEEEDSDENCSVDGEQDPRMTAPVSIDTEMSNLSLDENRPAYSRVKSDPQNSYPSSAQAASPLNLDQFRPESVPALPEHMQQPFVMPPNPASPTSGPYAQYAPAPIPLWSSHGRQPTTPAFPERQSSFPPPHPGTASGPYAAPYAARQGMAQGGANGAYGGPPMAPPPPRSSGPVYNTIHGDYNKVDQSVHSTNIGSGNTHNMLIQDSYNDNSVKTYAQPAPRPKRQGRMPSGYR